MGQHAWNEQRRATRRYLAKLLPGTLLDADQRVLQCKPIDISAEGLSILCGTILPVGSVLHLKSHKESIPLVIVWQKPDFGKQGLLRYGLRTVDPEFDLEALFRESGCLKL